MWTQDKSGEVVFKETYESVSPLDNWTGIAPNRVYEAKYLESVSGIKIRGRKKMYLSRNPTIMAISPSRTHVIQVFIPGNWPPAIYGQPIRIK